MWCRFIFGGQKLFSFLCFEAFCVLYFPIYIYLFDFLINKPAYICNLFDIFRGQTLFSLSFHTLYFYPSISSSWLCVAVYSLSIFTDWIFVRTGPNKKEKDCVASMLEWKRACLCWKLKREILTICTADKFYLCHIPIGHIFYTNVLSIQGSGATQGRSLLHGFIWE